MALDKKDMTQFEALMIKTINDALEQVVLPRLDRIENDVSDIKGRVSNLEGSVSNLESSVSNLEDTTERIERKLDIEIERNDTRSVKIDNHEKRLTRLELKKAS